MVEIIERSNKEYFWHELNSPVAFCSIVICDTSSIQPVHGPTHTLPIHYILSVSKSGKIKNAGRLQVTKLMSCSLLVDHPQEGFPPAGYGSGCRTPLVSMASRV